MTKKAFTLVELIVVITILAVLGTVAFVSFQNYVGNSRDSKRTTDIKNIEKALELSKLQTGVYPNPGTSTNITYSGATAWKQGEFNNDVVRVVKNFKEAPKDPLVDTFYGYSVTKNRGEYQLGGVLEDIDYGTSANGKLAGAYVKGNYNGKTVKVSTGSTTYVLAAPSILTSDLNETDLLNIINAQKLVYKNHKNLPASYTGTTYDVNGGFEFIPKSGTIVAYEGDLATVDSTTLVDNLQKIYTGTVISEEPDIEVIFSEDKDLTTDVILNKKTGTTASSSSSSSSSSSGGGGSIPVPSIPQLVEWLDPIPTGNRVVNNDLGRIGEDDDGTIGFNEYYDDYIYVNSEPNNCSIGSGSPIKDDITGYVLIEINGRYYKSEEMTFDGENRKFGYSVPVPRDLFFEHAGGDSFPQIITYAVVKYGSTVAVGRGTDIVQINKAEPHGLFSVKSIAGDNHLSTLEATQNITISGRTYAKNKDISLGDTIEIVINGNTYTDTLVRARSDYEGNFSITVPGSDIQAQPEFYVTLKGIDRNSQPFEMKHPIKLTTD